MEVKDIICAYFSPLIWDAITELATAYRLTPEEMVAVLADAYILLATGGGVLQELYQQFISSRVEDFHLRKIRAKGGDVGADG